LGETSEQTATARVRTGRFRFTVGSLKIRKPSFEPGTGRANQKMADFFTVEDSLSPFTGSAGIFKLLAKSLELWYSFFVS
jgi:hypothetical protein